MGLGCGVVDRCTCHTTASPLQVTYRTNSTFLSTVMCVAVNVDIHPLSNISPMEIGSPDCMWGEMCASLALVYNKGMRLSYYLWVA